MPNGHDKNYRLLMACAAYRVRFGQWPTHARFAPAVLQNLAALFDAESFERLALHLELRTSPDEGVAVGGAPGHIRYATGDFVEPPLAVVNQAEKWLNISVRRSAEGFESAR